MRYLACMHALPGMHACVTWRARDVRKPQARRALPVLNVCLQDLQVAGPYHKLVQTRQREHCVGVQVQDLAWRYAQKLVLSGAAKGNKDGVRPPSLWLKRHSCGIALEKSGIPCCGSRFPRA